MTLALAILLVLLAAVLTLSSYVERIFAETGKIRSREFQENIEAYELRVEPRLGRVRERIAGTMPVLSQLCTGMMAMTFVYLVMEDGHWDLARLGQALLAVVVVVVAFNRFLPFLFFTRTKGDWLAEFASVLKLLVYLMLPVMVVLNFCLSIVALAEAREPVEPETPAEMAEALIEAGQEEGLLHEGDRALIQGVVEFRDKTVREVMTPRPDVFAIPVSTTIESFTEMLQQRPYSRVPVYEGSLDNIRGMVFAHDVLQVTDLDAKTRTVAAMLKPLHVVPETKPVQDLMREMQRQKIHMAAVVDEYGGIAGVVTIEDLVEEIVGEIQDEHESAPNVVRENEHSFVVPGNLPVDRLEGLLGVRPEAEATTLAGLVSEEAGHIPQPGEVIDLPGGLRFEILQSTDRVVERLRVSLLSHPQASAGNSANPLRA